MKSEAPGGSSPGLSLLISLSFIRQQDFQYREKEQREKSLIFYSHTFLCTSGLTTVLREPDEFKASEKTWVKESQIRTEILLENLINQEFLWWGNTDLKTIWTFQPSHLFLGASIENMLLTTEFSSLITN